MDGSVVRVGLAPATRWSSLPPLEVSTPPWCFPPVGFHASTSPSCKASLWSWFGHGSRFGPALLMRFALGVLPTTPPCGGALSAFHTAIHGLLQSPAATPVSAFEHCVASRRSLSPCLHLSELRSCASVPLRPPSMSQKALSQDRAFLHFWSSKSGRFLGV